MCSMSGEITLRKGSDFFAHMLLFVAIPLDKLPRLCYDHIGIDHCGAACMTLESTTPQHNALSGFRHFP